MEKDCPKNTAEQKKLFLSLLSILLAKNNFEFVELFVLKICILNSKTSHQTPLRDLWRQSSFFDSFISPKYGKTKAGSTALEMVDHAIDRSSTGTVVFLQEMIETNRVF